MRIHHPSKIRDIVEYTGLVYDDAYVEDNSLSEDFCYTVNDIANKLDLAIGTVQTFIIPKLDIARAGEYIREYMHNSRLKIAISKRSFEEFVGWYIKNVDYDCDTYAISRINPEIDIDAVVENDEEDFPLEHKLLHELHLILENGKRIQPFINFATNYLEQNHFADYVFSEKEKEVMVEKAIKSLIDNDIVSFKQLKKKINKKHNQQVYRWLDRNAHTKLILNSLDKSGQENRDNVRYILKPNINVLDGNIVDTVSLEHGKPYFINVFGKTRASLKNLESDEAIYVLVLYTILENIDYILPRFEAWEKEQKEKKKKKESQ